MSETPSVRQFVWFLSMLAVGIAAIAVKRDFGDWTIAEVVAAELFFLGTTIIFSYELVGRHHVERRPEDLPSLRSPDKTPT